MTTKLDPVHDVQIKIEERRELNVECGDNKNS